MKRPAPGRTVVPASAHIHFTRSKAHRTEASRRISKTGSSRVRYLLVEAAWRIQHSRREELAALQQWTRGIAMRRGRKIATVALARRLAGILYALWRDGTTYEPRRLERPQE